MLYNPLPVWKDELRERTGRKVYSLDRGTGGIFRVAGSRAAVGPEPSALAEVLTRWRREAEIVEGDWRDGWRAEQTLLAQMARLRPAACSAAEALELMALPGDVVGYALLLPRIIELGREELLARRVREFAAALRVARAVALANGAAADILCAPLGEALARLGVGMPKLLLCPARLHI